MEGFKFFLIIGIGRAVRLAAGHFSSSSAIWTVFVAAPLRT